jgi:lipid-binding SYLF domain-containing protein
MRNIAMIMAFFALFTWVAWGQSNGSNNSGAKSQELSSAAQTVQQMTSSNQVPKQLLDQAQCVAVVPNMTKGGFIVGGKHGNGVVSCRTSTGWSAPAFISISGGSIGLQAGAEEAQIVLLMNKQGEQQLMNGNFQLGAEAVAAGPNGNNYNASTGWKAPVLSYTQSHGAYAGANIQGSTVQVDNSAMHNVYGSSTSAQKVLNGSVQTPQQAEQFVSALPQGGGMGR